MTSAYGHPVPVPAGVALAQRFGADIEPMDLTDSTDDEGSRRTRFIATMHALIAWLVAHPDVPTPWAVGINIRVADGATLERLAADLGVEAYPPRAPVEERQINVTRPIASDEFYTPIAIAVEHADRPL